MSDQRFTNAVRLPKYLTFSLEVIVSVYSQVCQVNALLKVSVWSTLVIEAFVPVYCLLRQVNASLVIYA